MTDALMDLRKALDKEIYRAGILEERVAELEIALEQTEAQLAQKKSKDKRRADVLEVAAQCLAFNWDSCTYQDAVEAAVGLVSEVDKHFARGVIK